MVVASSMSDLLIYRVPPLSSPTPANFTLFYNFSLNLLRWIAAKFLLIWGPAESRGNTEDRASRYIQGKRKMDWRSKPSGIFLFHGIRLRTREGGFRTIADPQFVNSALIRNTSNHLRFACRKSKSKTISRWCSEAMDKQTFMEVWRD